jgi:hypothetical protein
VTGDTERSIVRPAVVGLTGRRSNLYAGMVPEAFKGSSARADDAADAARYDAARYCEEAIESMSGFGPEMDMLWLVGQ